MIRAVAIWGVLAAAILAPLAVAAGSPLLQWRQPVYVAAGFAGVLALGLMLAQPLLAAGRLPGLSVPMGRRAHRWIGAGIVAAVAVHVGGLWITSPPDVIDALTFASPTPFSVWGVLAMWALLSTAALAILRRRVPPRLWRRMHAGSAVVIVGGTAVHAVLIQGTMGTVSKWVLCALALGALAWVLPRMRLWPRSGPGALARRGPSS